VNRYTDEIDLKRVAALTLGDAGYFFLISGISCLATSGILFCILLAIGFFINAYMILRGALYFHGTST
jgi:hypothetical protein